MVENSMMQPSAGSSLLRWMSYDYMPYTYKGAAQLQVSQLGGRPWCAAKGNKRDARIMKRKATAAVQSMRSRNNAQRENPISPLEPAPVGSAPRGQRIPVKHSTSVSL